MTGETEGVTGARLPELEPMEVYAGYITGLRRSPMPPPPEPPLTGTPREVLEAILVEPLSDPPCHVAFSGGRDSSAMLAVATLVARRHGLPDPVPLTARLEEHPRTWETDWQERTIRHLGLRDWTRVSITDELDALGAYATDGLRRHGLYWPTQAHSILVFASRAGGGTMLTGGGGDEVFTRWTGRPIPKRDLLKLRPWRRALKWFAFMSLPNRVRVNYQLRGEATTLPWLRPDAQRTLQEDRRRRAFEASTTWGAVLEFLLESRYLELVRATLGTFAADHGVRLFEPFYDPRFVRAMSAAGGPQGYHNRTAALEAHFSDILPPEVLRRGTKAVFTEVAWGPGARGFVERWDGSGLDESIVDVARLREEWAKERPDGRSLSCLHQAWLAEQGLG